MDSTPAPAPSDAALLRALANARHHFLASTGRAAEGWLLRWVELGDEAEARGLVRRADEEPEEG
jgi:hypothetical protein